MILLSIVTYILAVLLASMRNGHRLYLDLASADNEDNRWFETIPFIDKRGPFYLIALRLLPGLFLILGAWHWAVIIVVVFLAYFAEVKFFSPKAFKWWLKRALDNQNTSDNKKQAEQKGCIDYSVFQYKVFELNYFMGHPNAAMHIALTVGNKEKRHPKIAMWYDSRGAIFQSQEKSGDLLLPEPKEDNNMKDNLLRAFFGLSVTIMIVASLGVIVALIH